MTYFYSCKKEESTVLNNENNLINLRTNEEDTNVSRFFDAEYLEQIIENTGIDPYDLSQNELFKEYISSQTSIYLCISNIVFSDLNENSSLRNDIIEQLENANNYFNNNDTLNGLQEIENLFSTLNCNNEENILFNDNHYYIPVNSIISNFEYTDSIFNSLITFFPDLSNLDYNSRTDLFVFAELYIQNNLKTAPFIRNCCNEWKARMRVIKEDWENCLSIAVSGHNIFEIIIMGTICNAHAAIRTQAAANQYTNCIGSGGTGC